MEVPDGGSDGEELVDVEGSFLWQWALEQQCVCVFVCDGVFDWDPPQTTVAALSFEDCFLFDPDVDVACPVYRDAAIFCMENRCIACIC